MTKVNVKLQSNESWTMTGSYHFEIKSWVISSDKEPVSAEVLAETKRSKKQIVEEDSFKYKLYHM